MKTIEVKMSDCLASELAKFAKGTSLEDLEYAALNNNLNQLPFMNLPLWQDFVKEVSEAWKTNYYFVVRGIPIVDSGSTTILTALSLQSKFKFYRNDKIVKCFKMSPWTSELSHTIKEGDFHTDINTAKSPPATTVIHCFKPDPDPSAGISRVVLLRDLLEHLKVIGAEDTITFLTKTKVDMVDERQQGTWSGCIVDGDSIRFHPATLRAAAKRLGSFPEDLESHLSCIYKSAMAVSEPIHLSSGDALFVSNKHALHYRGACTAQYIEFPRNFVSREIYVLHLQDEPKWKS